MEAVPSVPFHERAPDLMKEEDLKNNQIEAEESANRLQGNGWQPHRDVREGIPEDRQQRADISYRLAPDSEDKAVGASEMLDEPSGTAAQLAEKGQTSYDYAALFSTGTVHVSQDPSDCMLMCLPVRCISHHL